MKPRQAFLSLVLASTMGLGCHSLETNGSQKSFVERTDRKLVESLGLAALIKGEAARPEDLVAVRGYILAIDKNSFDNETLRVLMFVSPEDAAACNLDASIEVTGLSPDDQIIVPQFDGALASIRGIWKPSANGLPHGQIELIRRVAVLNSIEDFSTSCGHAGK